MGEKYYMKGKRPKPFKWRKRIAIAVVLYTLIGFFVVPAIIKWQMVKQLPALTHRTAAVEQVKVNPYAFSLTIRGFSLKEPDGQVFASFDEFYINFQPVASLFKWTWVFSDISLKKPYAQLTYNADGTFNFANLIPTNAPPKPAPKTPAPLPRLLVYSMKITNGVVAINDLKRQDPFHTEFSPIDLNLTNLTTVRDKDSPYSFIARTGAGETFAWAGTITANPLGSAGTFRLGGLKLGKYSTYGHDFASYEIADGLLDVAADYHYDSATNLMDLLVSNAAVHLTRLQLKAPDNGDMLINVPALSITDTEANVLQRKARVGLIKSSGGSVLVGQNQDGSINLLSLLKLPQPAAPAANSAAAQPATNAATAAEPMAFSAKIDEIAFDNWTIKAYDRKPAKAADFNIDQLAFDVKNISNASNAPVTASVSFRYAETGFIAVNGSATLLPPSADLEINVTNLDLRSIQPYVEQQVKLAITSGAVDVKGRAKYASPEPNAPLISFTGNVAVNNFATADDVLFKDFTKWDALNVDGIKVTLQPEKLDVDRVKFTGLNTSLIIGPDHRANLQTILRDKLGMTNNLGTNTAATNVSVATATNNAPAAEKVPLPEITLGEFALEKASIHFADQSLEPHASFDVQELSGTIKGLSSRGDTPAILDMKGSVDARSPFVVSGKLNPLVNPMFADVTVTFTNTELTSLTPYTEKFVGRPLTKGKVSLAVHYLVVSNALKAENFFYVDQLTLGAKNNSPDATSLPVKLAISLLKDRNGRIILDVPVAGRLDDPKFNVWPVIWHVVDNILIKAATSPFSLLGAMFGGGEELSFVSYEPGSADISEAEAKKLETLTKALAAHPDLSVEITGSVDPARDREPLARLALEQQLKSLWIKEQTEAGKPAVALADVKLTPEEHDRLLKKQYKQILGWYKPTPVGTNGVGGATKKIAALLAAMPPAEKTQHGATLLEEPGGTKAAPAKGNSTATAAPVAQRKTPLTRAELELADMEDQLMSRIPITNDDLRDLMQKRAAAVQNFLLQGGQVTADRLFIIAPKPIDASFKGEDRANLSLN